VLLGAFGVLLGAFGVLLGACPVLLGTTALLAATLLPATLLATCPVLLGTTTLLGATTGVLDAATKLLLGIPVLVPGLDGADVLLIVIDAENVAFVH